MILLSPIEDKEEKVKEPSKAWRNKFEVLHVYRSSDSGCVREPGEVLWGCRLFPSKDTAESFAMKQADNPNHVYFNGWVQWLGAFPITE